MTFLGQVNWLTSNLICWHAFPSQPRTSFRPGQLMQASRGEQAAPQRAGRTLQKGTTDATIQKERRQQSERSRKSPTDKNQQNRRRSQHKRDEQDAAKVPKNLTPMQMTGYIKEEWRAAAHHMRRASDPDQTLSLYMQRMDELCTTCQKNLNYVHMSAILYGFAQIWIAAEENHPGFKHRQTHELSLQAFLSRMLVTVQQMLSSIGSREASSILWSFAKVGLHPDSLVLDIVDGLATRFTEDISSATGQSYSSMMLACKELRLDPCEGTTLPATLQGLSTTDMSSFSAQATSNIVYCLATMPRVQPTIQLLNGLCGSFLQSVDSQKKFDRPSPQAIAHFVKSLQQLKHLPAKTVMDALLVRMLDFCHDPTQQVPPREISNFLLAYADLRCAITQEQATVLFARLLAGPRANTQDLANAAWAAAVLECLQLQTLRQMLQHLQALKSRLNTAQMAQLHQALDWVDVSSDARLQHSTTWSEVQAQLQELGPKPAVAPSSSDVRTTEAVSEALAKLCLQHSVGIPVRGYWMQAVLQPCLSGQPKIMIACIVAPDCFINHPARLTGRAVFWRKLLAKEGTVIEVPLEVAEQSVDELAEHLESRLKAAAGGSLDAYPVSMQLTDAARF